MTPAARRRALIVVGVLLVLCCGGGFALYIKAARGDARERSAAATQVAIISCVTDTGSPSAKLTVTNRGTTPHRYRITVAFEDGGSQFAEGFTTIGLLWPDQTATAEAPGHGGRVPDSFTCRVVDIARS
jgi:hypothetical protein